MRLLQLPLPVIPEFGRNIGEVSGRLGDELFSVLFAVGKSKHFDLRVKAKGGKFCVNEGTFGCATTLQVPPFARSLQALVPAQGRLPSVCFPLLF